MSYSPLVRSEREKRAWSQEQLARVTGLGVRTIQRIETGGSASLESMKALASVFELDISELRSATATTIGVFRIPAVRKSHLAALTASLLLATGLFVAKPILAQQLWLDFDISAQRQDEDQILETSVRAGRVLMAENESTMIQLNNLLRLEVTPQIQADGKEILLSIKLFENRDGEYSLRAEPRIMTADKLEATLESSSDSGYSYNILMTPIIE